MKEFSALIFIPIMAADSILNHAVNPVLHVVICTKFIFGGDL